MNAEICFHDDIFLIAKAEELTSSLRQNEQIACRFWQFFNAQLKHHHLKQGSDFCKYALTLRQDTKLYYLCAVPSNGNYPSDFELIRIPRGHYLKFQHHGSHKTIGTTLRQIFGNYLSTHNYQRKTSKLQYYEKYTNTFHFERMDSIIEIYVPIVITETAKEFPQIPAKSLLQGKGCIQHDYSKFSWFGMDYCMNLYKGCTHGCIYCDSRSSCYRVEHFDIVRGKEHELDLLEQELRKKRRRGTIGIGAMSDTYNPIEKTQGITRNALQCIDHYGFGIGLDTKSTLILRDIDIIEHIARQYPSIIKITITCADDSLGKIIEPHAALSSERFAMFDEFHKHHIFAGILMMPILPFINDTEENIRGIVQLAHQHHAKFIYPAFGVTLRNNQRDYYYYQLNRYFPGKMALYEKHYHNVYSCDTLNAHHLWNIFKKECQKYGILYKMNDIIQGYKSAIPNEQMKLIL